MTTLDFDSFQIPHPYLPAWMLSVLCPLRMQYSSTQPQPCLLTLDAECLLQFRCGWSYTGLQIRSLTLGEAMLSDDAFKEVAIQNWEWEDNSINKVLAQTWGTEFGSSAAMQEARCHSSSFQSHHWELMFHFSVFPLLFLL